MAARKLLPQFLENGDDEDWGIESVVRVPISFQNQNTLDEAGTIAQLTTAKEQIEVPNNVVVVPNTDKKQPKKKAVKKPDNINGAIPMEKQKYYQYLIFTALQLYSKDIYNKENDLFVLFMRHSVKIIKKIYLIKLMQNQEHLKK